ncbi:fatty acid synthase-like [Periplaneta americana]|uniref:fatty acid synthase-like n=1 Tax=Periplaneta americana TaxID=6978 RepID=UPI0037E74376
MPEPLGSSMDSSDALSGDEVVISGMSGCFPESRNMHEFQENLFQKVDMVTDDDRRWRLESHKVPQRMGKLLDVEKFDASFFNVSFKEAHTMDPMARILMEKVYETLADAGVNPAQVRGKRIGVYLGRSFSESEKTWFYEKLQEGGLGYLGCCQSIMANRISQWLGILGPSYMVDTACSSSVYALEHAYRAIRDGDCEAAIVAACNLCLHPYITIQLWQLGVLSDQGMCRCFDRDANGYVRSEAVAAVYLQKARDAKRVYARVVHAKTNCDGYKERGITFPSKELHRVLQQKFYQECGINPATISFMEAHGTGTEVGDPEELATLDKVYCTGRDEPLLIGSVKSNIGHTEPVAGMCSIAKMVVAMETGFIPPNLHYDNRREGVDGLAEGRLKVVTEKCPLRGGLVGINSFGFGGANAHILLDWNHKTKVKAGAPSDHIPRLVVASGRTKEAVDVILNDLEGRPLDAEYVSLLHDFQAVNIPGHCYRGYTLLSKEGPKQRSIKFWPGCKRPVWLVFSGLGSQWPCMGRSLLQLPTFTAAVDRCRAALQPHGVDVLDILTSEDPGTFSSIVNCLVGIAACQIGLVDVIKAVGIEVDGIVGHSVGELGCGYMDGCLTAEQMVLAAYFQGRACLEANLAKGCMVTVGTGVQHMKKVCPPDIEVVCHDAPNSCTLSGPAESVKKLTKLLQQKGVSVRELHCAGVALHSKQLAGVALVLLKNLRKLIPHPKCRSAHWVSSSAPGNSFSSAEFHTQCLLGPVLFADAAKRIPPTAVVMEVAPHGVLHAALGRVLHKAAVCLALTQRMQPDGTHLLLTGLGKLFQLGLQPQLAKLYPPVQYPMSRGTPMISPLILWEHSQDWYVMSYKAQSTLKYGEKSWDIDLDDDMLEYLSGHVIDGRVLYPATGYIDLVWMTVKMMLGSVYTEMNICLENVHFHRATTIPKDGAVELVVMVQKVSGNFEVVEGKTAVVTGSFYLSDNISEDMVELEPPAPACGDDELQLTSRDIYKELRLRGYHYKGVFRSIVSADCSRRVGNIRWNNNWVAFMDSMIQMQLLHKDTRTLLVPTFIQKLSIDDKKHSAVISAIMDQNNDEEKDILLPVHFYEELNVVKLGGVEVRGLRFSPINLRRPQGEPVLETHGFMEYSEPPELELLACVRVCVHLVLENQKGSSGSRVKVVELLGQGTEPLAGHVVDILGDLPLIQADMTVVASADNPSVADLESSKIKVEDRKLDRGEDCRLIIAANILSDTKLLDMAVKALADGAFILTRETAADKSVEADLDVVFEKTLEDCKLLLLRKRRVVSDRAVISVSSDDYSWLPQLQTALSSSSDSQIVLVSQGDPLSGILGLVSCVSKEPGCDHVRCVFIPDASAPPFDLNLPLYEQQLRKDLLVNIYTNGRWGSYCHLPLVASSVMVEHAYCNVTTRGDLSSLKWLQGGIRADGFGLEPHEVLVHVYYSALNFRDVMTATGRISPALIANTRFDQECVQGLEFSGITQDSRRVMGLFPFRALANLVISNTSLMWEFPDHWTLEEAATVPVVYSTAYYALKMIGGMKKGDSVLIHSGSGGVGQAAIHICLHEGCRVFTTVGTPEKRQFIKKQFPQLTDEDIGNSRDTSFEQLVMQRTAGRGVDLVLNSLAEEKLLASVRCLASNGRFLEIGKFDLSQNNPLGMEVFLKGTSFHGVMLDNIFTAPIEMVHRLHDMICEGVKSGAVQPLTRTVFSAEDVEQAFRFMASGKHIGKVLVQIRPEEEEKAVIPSSFPMQAQPRFICKPECTYVIAGGLGGFGLELADWLVLRGARKLVLTSRSGLRTGYQSYRVRIWHSYGVTVNISLADITSEEGVTSLLSEANKLGPVDAIFNLAVVLQDNLVSNQTETSFAASAGPKALATRLLDKLSRQMCPLLQKFVVFSSVSCGRGNAGQANYGMSNSVMERVCEARVRDGLPGLAVQWGAVGDVGLVAEMHEDHKELVIGGTLQQRISSCLEMLDVLLTQTHPVVSSMVVAEKRAGRGSYTDVVGCVSSILGIRDLKTVSQTTTLAELGMDSMTAVEMKQTLEREFEVLLTAQEIRSLTFGHLEKIAADRKQAKSAREQQAQVLPGEGGRPFVTCGSCDNPGERRDGCCDQQEAGEQ